MIPAVRAVSGASAVLVPSGNFVPAGIWGIFKVVNAIHSTWRWYRWSKIYSNPENFFQITSGHMLNFAAGDRLLVRIAAQCVLISSCIISCADQQAALSRAYQKWKESLVGKYSAPMNCQWKKEAGWTSPSSHQKISRLFYHAALHICTVAYRTYKLFLQIFRLSMRTMDAIEAFSLSPATKNESVNEFFLNSTKCLDALESNQKELIEKLQKNKQIIAKILATVGAQDKTDQLINYVSQSMEKVRNIKGTADSVNKAANGLILEFIRNGALGIFSVFDIVDYLPDYLLPADDDLLPGSKLYERYPPVQWVTRSDQRKDKPKKTVYWEKESLPFQPSRYLPIVA